MLAWLVPVSAAGTVLGTAVVWRRGDWSRRARIHQTILGVAFTWQLVQLGFFAV